MVAAHPDDDILGCGETLKKLTKLKNVRAIFVDEDTSCRFKNYKNYKNYKNLKIKSKKQLKKNL